MLTGARITAYASFSAWSSLSVVDGSAASMILRIASAPWATM
jgi:hypothetical protein